MNNELTVIEQREGEVVLSETKTYTATMQQLRAELESLKYNKRSIVDQSKELKRQFDEMTKRETAINDILTTLEPAEDGFVAL